MKKPVLEKRDSFFGDRSIVLTKRHLELIKNTPLNEGLYISDIGFYPCAKNHFRKREKGINEHILIYCIDGSGMIQIEENSHVLEPNTFFVISAKKKHMYWSTDYLPWSIYWLHFGGERSNCFEVFYNRVIKIEQSPQSRINDRIVLFNEVLTALEADFSIENINFANMNLSSLLASFFYIETFRIAKGLKNQNPVDKSIFYMQKNLNKSLTVKELSSHVELSESHFSKIFRNRTGSPPLEYFINLKMQEAIRLLTNQSFRIKEVAFKLGYNDPYYFSRIFTKHIGSSPGSFL